MLFNLKVFAPALLPIAAFCVAVEAPGHFEIRTQPKGIDISSHQGNVDWNTVVANGVSFAFIKATEGTTYKNPYFSSQYTGATKAGLIRGGYHFALPDRSSGVAQANWFASNGGGWSGDGITLPGALDVEYNPYGATCYGLSAASMVDWIRDFSNTYHSRVGRYPVIYTTTNWWRNCTDDSPAFASNSPLWIARYSSSVGLLPDGWSYHTFWQYADSGPVPGDQNYFNGDMAGLRRLAAS
ncbi:glycoside hydrolase family 25 protein [Thelephora ganbajun]|uniref:Glycoside hydrolase family 25 protein n=1 Tax=Thelephora ganbajun TaxID=370292 RepID=A0ACB6ZJJ7_THEGA|nr:glycoside hydrolase family 25 protein [Thelephora ganbajun]